MHRAVRAVAVVSAAALTLLLTAAAALHWFDWSSVKDEIAARAGDRLGTSVEIAGDLDVDLGLGTVRVRAGGIRIAGSLPASEPLLALQRLDAVLALRPLLAGDVVLERLVLTEPRVRLMRNTEGEVNWDFEKTEPEKPAPALPAIEHLEIQGGALEYRDAALEAPVDLVIGRVVGALPRRGTARLTGTGRLESQPVRLELHARPVEHREDFAIDGSLAIADATLALEGTIARPDLRVALHVPESAKLGFLPVPAHLRSADFALNVRLTRDSAHWLLDGLEATLGAQRLSGDVRLDTDTTPPTLYATLSLNRLELPPRGEREPGARELIRPIPIDITPLGQLNARVDLRVGAVANAPLPVENLAFVAQLQDKRLTVRPLSGHVAGGTVQGTVEFDASLQVPVATARLTLRDLRLGAAIPDRGRQSIAGDVSGRIDLRTSGADVEKLFGNLEGQMLFVMRDGSVPAAWVEAIDLDLAEAVLAGASGATTPIRCGLIAFDAQDGVLRPRPVVIDTRDSLITLEGLINLDAETLLLTLRAYPKDPSILSARGPIRIGGSLADPSIDVLTPPVVGRGAAALALGALLGPLAGLLPLVEPGLTEDRNCRRLLADTPPRRLPRGSDGGRQ